VRVRIYVFSRLFYEADRGPRLATSSNDDHVETNRPLEVIHISMANLSSGLETEA
jgi:hypothetical protein